MQYFRMQQFFLDEQDQQALQRATVAIAGLGGIGAPALELLARNGVQHFRLADGDCYDDTNCRQLFQTVNTIGLSKVDAAHGRVLAINREAQVATYEDGLKPSNYLEFCSGADAICSQSDDATAFLLVHLGAAKYRVPVFHAARASIHDRYQIRASVRDYREITLDPDETAVEFGKRWGVEPALIRGFIEYAEREEDCPELHQRIIEANHAFRCRTVRSMLNNGEHSALSDKSREYLLEVAEKHPDDFYKMAVTPEMCFMMGALLACAVKDALLGRAQRTWSFNLRDGVPAEAEQSVPVAGSMMQAGGA